VLIAALGDFTPEHNLKKVYMIKEAEFIRISGNC
jgi:hypothetical protein